MCALMAALGESRPRRERAWRRYMSERTTGRELHDLETADLRVGRDFRHCACDVRSWVRAKVYVQYTRRAHNLADGRAKKGAA